MIKNIWRLILWYFKNKSKVGGLKREILEAVEIAKKAIREESKGGKKITKSESLDILRATTDVLEAAQDVVESLPE